MIRPLATRVFVISDLHLGGDPAAPAGQRMMSRPDALAAYIRGLPARKDPGEHLVLVLAGDTIDFLATPLAWPSEHPQSEEDGREAWTEDPARAVGKLRVVTDPPSPFARVFDALAGHLARGHELVVVAGNHDLELGWPAVQRALCERLGVPHGRVRFVDDDRPWRLGGLLVEHGNRYDPVNVNDWDGLAAWRSAWERGEPGAPARGLGLPRALVPSDGSRVVEKVINPLKRRHPWIDLFQPQGPLVAFLLLALEPALKHELGMMLRMGQAARRSASNRRGDPQRVTRPISDAGDDPAEARFGPPLALDAVAAELGVDLPRGATRPASARDWARLLLRDDRDGLWRYMADDSPIPDDRLAGLQAALRGMKTDPSDALSACGPVDHFERAATWMLGAGVQTVVMGHTHHPRGSSDDPVSACINTGTWSDVVVLEPLPDDRGSDLLAPEGRAAFERWLRALYRDDPAVRQVRPRWADVRVAASGRVERARLDGSSADLLLRGAP